MYLLKRFSQPLKQGLIALLLSSSLTLTAQANPTVTIVILPFKNITQQSEDQWLQESFSENLTMGLGNIENLKIVERGDLQRILKEQSFGQSAYVEAESAPRVGKMLGAKYAVLGSYQRIGSQILVNVKVVDTETGAIATGTLTQVKGEYSDLFALQEQLAERLMQKLHLGISQSNAPQSKPTIDTTRSTPAHEAYIKARLLREKLGDANITQAITLLQQALSIDPNYARAASELSRVYYDRANGKEIYRSATAEDLNLAEQFAQKAIILDPNAAHGYSMLSQVLAAKNKRGAALTLSQRALELEKSTESILAYLQLKYPQFFNVQQRQKNTASDSLDSPENLDSLDLLVQEMKALGANMADPQILFTLGGLYFSQIHENPQANIDTAIDYYQQAHAKNPNNPFYTFTLSAVYMLQNEVKKAENIIAPLMESNPENLRLLISGAQAAQRLLPDLGQINNEKKILQRYPEYTLAYFHLATLYAQQEKANPDNVILLLSGAQALQTLMPEAAMRWSRSAIENFPDFAEAYFQLAQLYLQQGKDPQQADLWFNQGLELIGNDPNAAYAASRYLITRQSFDKAQRYLTQALNIWQARARDGDLSSLAQYYLSLNTQAKLFIAQNKDTEALNTYQQVAKSILPPLQQGLAYQRMAEIYDRRNEPKKAFEAYQAYMTRFPQRLQSIEAQNIYQGYFAQKNLRSQPNNPDFLNDVGQAHLARGEYDEALKYLGQARQRAPKNAVIHYNMGLAYLGQNQLGYALSAFEQAIVLNPKYSKAYYNLGVVYYQQRRLPVAQEAWQKALALNPEFEAAREALKAVN